MADLEKLLSYSLLTLPGLIDGFSRRNASPRSRVMAAKLMTLFRDHLLPLSRGMREIYELSGVSPPAETDWQAILEEMEGSSRPPDVPVH